MKGKLLVNYGPWVKRPDIPPMGFDQWTPPPEPIRPPLAKKAPIQVAVSIWKRPRICEVVKNALDAAKARDEILGL